MRKVPVLAVLAATTIAVAGAAFALAGDDGGGPELRIQPAGVDISGPCDEAEHADDPACTGVTVTTPAPSTLPAPPPLDDGGSQPGDISGPCDEAEHADDPRCTGVGGPVEDDDSGPSDDSGHGSDDSGHGSDDDD